MRLAVALLKGEALITQLRYQLLPTAAARARELSKNYLDQTLDHDPDRGPDQVANRTLNRDQAKESDRDAGSKADRTVELAPKRDSEPIAGRGKKPVAEPAQKPVAEPAQKPFTAAGKKPVAAPAKKLVPGAGEKPVAGPGRQSAATGGDQPAALDQTVEQRAEQRVEVIIPIEMQIVIEVPGAGKVRGATENMSCSGMLARLNGPIPPDSRCQVHFLSAEDITPSQVSGRVIRIAKSRYGYSVAFRFERPVQIRVTPLPPKKR